MPRTAPLRLALVGGLLLAGCASGGQNVDGGADHQPPPGRGNAADVAGPEPRSPGDPPADPTVPPLHPSVDGYPEALVTLTGGEVAVEIPVKLADTEDLQAHGLMEVEDLPDGTGMLFVFDQDRVGGFWMKDTLVPLDIAFVAAGGGILDVMAMDPCTADPCEVHDPGVPYRSALEVPQGWFDRVGIGAGDELAWEPLTTAR